MRTIIAPLSLEVEQDLGALDRRRAEIARRYIRRLALEPGLGGPIERGLLAGHRCRRIYFDRDDRPDDLFGGSQRRARRGDQDLSEGPAWRIVYWIREAPLTQVRVVAILAVARGHAVPPTESAYELADQRLRSLIRQKRGGQE